MKLHFNEANNGKWYKDYKKILDILFDIEYIKTPFYPKFVCNDGISLTFKIGDKAFEICHENIYEDTVYIDNKNYLIPIRLPLTHLNIINIYTEKNGYTTKEYQHMKIENDYYRELLCKKHKLKNRSRKKLRTLIKDCDESAKSIKDKYRIVADITKDINTVRLRKSEEQIYVEYWQGTHRKTLNWIKKTFNEPCLLGREKTKELERRMNNENNRDNNWDRSRPSRLFHYIEARPSQECTAGGSQETITNEIH